MHQRTSIPTPFYSVNTVFSHSTWCMGPPEQRHVAPVDLRLKDSRSGSECVCELCDRLAACPHCLPAFCDLLWIQLPVDCTMWTTKQTPCFALCCYPLLHCSALDLEKNPHFHWNTLICLCFWCLKSKHFCTLLDYAFCVVFIFIDLSFHYISFYTT